ncbi:MAG TPA: glycosyltransferase family 39 protein [Flavipsychrobacter sp.]|nr:glycosyltransferase family 39 protein [Flavipsychrobacter sp.]
MQIKRIEKIAKFATIGLVVYLLCFGAASVLFPIRPFWNDEWRLIYNIKFKDYEALWGRLDLLQECPRVYLSLLKFISSNFDYSYTSLRMPPFIIGVASVFLLFYLQRKFFPRRQALHYLFILILVSSQTFTDYLTQVKQYEMDIFLCLVALWQLFVLLEISREGIKNRLQYALVCIIFWAVPYLSYTYPIVVAPIYPVILLASFSKTNFPGNRIRHFSSLYAPLVLAALSILAFYLVDVQHVMSDKNMYDSYLKVYYDGGKPNVFQNFWNLFALIGSGFLFEVIFGVLGIAGFGYAAYRILRKKINTFTLLDYFTVYALALLVLVLCLLFTGKIVGGVARLTAYTVPSISILIITLLEDLRAKYGFVKLSKGIAAVLFIGLAGNIITSCINTFTYSEYKRRITTYLHTAKALKEARLRNVPFLYTDGVCGDQWEVAAPVPGTISRYTITPRQIAGADTVAAEVIVKVNPEYKVWDSIPLYYMPDSKWMAEYVKQLPDSLQRAMVGDGINYQIREK